MATLTSSSPRLLAAVAVAGTLLSGQAMAQADEARAKRIHGGSCFLCHGMNGESTSEVFPRLAGQNAQYIAKQLEAFKTGKRKSSAMADPASRLSSDEMLALGRLYEKMEPPKENAKDNQLAAVGQYIYHQGNRFSGVPSCASCHGANGEGASNLPRLATQFSGYLFTQLKQFNNRQRTDDNLVMHVVVEKMTELEMAAVSEYLSGK